MIPKVNEQYHFFDDGKISESRHEIVTIEEICDLHSVPLDVFDAWRREVKYCVNYKGDPYLYAKETDFFIKARGEQTKELWFVRTISGGWFSIDYPKTWTAGKLDITGELYKQLHNA
ncbi:hypothetical protein [Intestinibacter sp.]|uniref:hypothetical protein n=1 Tax=Intestinibacter sp. TaxID=1965304 RepID=UPI003F19083E